jgi:hypothetical protein
LKWEDFGDGEVRIERAMSRTEVVETTKTGKARRGLTIEPVNWSNRFSPSGVR